MMRELGKPRGLADPALPKAIENVESTTVPVSHDTFSEADEARDYKFCHVLLATLEGDAMDEVLNLPRGYGLEWWRRTGQRHPTENIWTLPNPTRAQFVPSGWWWISCPCNTLGESSQGVRASDHRQSGKS